MSTNITPELRAAFEALTSGEYDNFALDCYREIYGHPLAHIEIEALEPARVPLLVTETGYRSHFTSPEEIAQAGGPVPFVRAALDQAAEDPAWKEREAAARQYSLF